VVARDPLAAARARLVQLQAQHDAGTLDARRYADERATLEREIGALLLAGPAPTSTASRALGARPSRGLVASLVLIVVAVAAIGYSRTGSPSLLRGGATLASAAAPEAPASGATALQQIEAMVGKLAERMKSNPDDAQGWTMLARSYTVLGRFAEALPAYQRATALQPANASLLADYADAVAATHGTVNNPESIALVERALKADPRHPKALALAGTVAYDRGDYPSAIAHWQQLAAQLGPGSELTPRVQAMIADAREHLGGAGPTSAAARGASADALAAAAPSAPSGTAALLAPSAGAETSRVSGTVTLDPALAGRAAPDDSVFVFARAENGSRMPLAVRRAQVKDLPLAFTLDDSMAMAPGRTLSSAPQLIVGARISKSGNAIPQPGDLAGEASGVKPGAKNVAIRIGTVVARP
jgi:cytochrome c-type biogenesis protein CcmH